MGSGHPLHGTRPLAKKLMVEAKFEGCEGVDGPWKLQRCTGLDRFGKPTFAILPNSIRSTSREAERLIAEERARTGMEWEMTRL